MIIMTLKRINPVFFKNWHFSYSCDITVFIALISADGKLHLDIFKFLYFTFAGIMILYFYFS